MPEFKQQAWYLSASSSLGPDKLLLRALRGEEALSEPFLFELELDSQDAAVDPESLLGQPLTVTLQLHGGSQRYLHGRVTRVMASGTGPRFTRYRAELRPWFWLLSLVSDCRIYQNQTVPEIFEALCTELGFQDYRNALTGSYEKREYCVQYNETAFQFLSRLLEDEGIFYYFAHEAGKHTLVLADDAGDLPKLPGAAKLHTGRPRSGQLHNSDDVLERVWLEQCVTPGAWRSRDYFFQTPGTTLESNSEGGQPSRRIYTYPGRFENTGQGDAITRRRLEAVEAPAKILRGEGACRALQPGYAFTLEGQERSALNTDYVLRRVTHEATQDRYASSFEAFPSTVPFRPPLATPRPRVFGCQTAVVCGKAGEEIWTDEYGRVKVQFHWDRLGQNDEKSSCWIRVDQGWAGKNWGAFFLPRIGQEVLITFLEGDPDQPIVSGALYNAEHTVPYGLPANQTRSTIQTRSSKSGTAGNEIRFEDKKDSEELYVHAQKDYNIVVENSRTTTIKEKDDTLTVEKGKRAVNVKTGNETHDNGANFTHTVQGNYELKVTGNLTIDVTGSVTIKSGTAWKAQGGVSLSTQAPTISHKADASQTVDGGGLLTAKGGLVKIN